MPFSKEADDELAEFEARVEPRLGADGDLHGLCAWGTKLAGEVARIAGTLHLAEAAGVGRLSNPGPVPVEAVRAAVRLAEHYLVPHAVRAFGVMHANPAEVLAQRIVRWLCRNPQLTTVKGNEVFQSLKGGQSDLKADDLIPAFEILESHNYLRRIEPAKARPGPKPVLFEVNPLWDRSKSCEPSPKSPELGQVDTDLGDEVPDLESEGLDTEGEL